MFVLSEVEVERLKQFHLDHFPNSPVPDISPSITDHQQGLQTSQTPYVHDAKDAIYDEDSANLNDDDGLGYYDDGVKRTLTDEQIRIFRHSEIQKLFAERRRTKQREREKKKDWVRNREQKNKHSSGHVRPRQFQDDEMGSSGTHAALIYDDIDAAPATQSGKVQAVESHGKKFLWPVLGK